MALLSFATPVGQEHSAILLRLSAQNVLQEPLREQVATLATLVKRGLTPRAPTTVVKVALSDQ